MMNDTSIIKEESFEKASNKYKSSKDGYLFDPESNLWILNKDVQISFQKDVLSIEIQVLKGFRNALSRYAQELSAAHTYNMYRRFQKFLRDTGSKEISANAILNWRATLDDTTEWYLGALKGFIISWHDFGYYGISRDVISTLNKMTLKGNVLGLAVTNRCPYTGAMTQNEQLSIYNELNRLFDNDKISLTTLTHVSILQATARRTVQIRQLKSKDLIKESDPQSNSTNYYLNIPRAKQRGGGFRKEFKKIAITEDLYLIIFNLIEENISKIVENNKIILSSEQKLNIPIFIDWNVAFEVSKKNLTGNEILHKSSRELDLELNKFAKIQTSISERTGEIIQISARRFRRTRGTNLGRKGISVFIIAEALDHSTTQSAKIYTENTADTVIYIDEAVGKKLSTFARAFKGQIITDLSEGELGDDPTARVPNSDTETVGACGTTNFCVKGYESCYLCEKFRPLLDAPHEKFLNSLYKEKKLRLSKTNSEQYASTKDSLILAVEWVVSECQRMKEINIDGTKY